TEAAQLDRLVEQLGLWIRLLGGDYKVRSQRVDLAAVLGERLEGWLTLPAEPVAVMADKGLLLPAAEGIRDFLKAYVQHNEEAGVRVSTNGRMAVHGPLTLVPVLQTVTNSPVPDLQAAGGPAMWLIGPALAVAACRACGGEAWLEDDERHCTLWLAWPAA
ncbi:MAG TPA: hypothetical protein VD902_06805, partial [Symbiobacteriaceae bacterium]|nr:hypothetical protein [Symbiobacteriaceae bacterium]